MSCMKSEKGIVFSIDAVFALYIMLLLLTAFAAVLQVQAQPNDDVLYISRLARDVYEIKEFSLSATLPGGVSEGSDACADEKIAGSAFALVYDPGTNGVNVQPKVVCVNG